MKTILNFGGFYESWHEQFIDDAIECMTDEEHPEPKYDYKKLTEAYSKVYVDFVNEELKTSLQFIELISPREYNFSTDRIEVSFSDEDEAKIRQFIIDNDLTEKLNAHIIKLTTSVSGYRAFYTFDEIMNDNEYFIQAALDVLINEYLDNSDEDYYQRKWISYYHDNHIENNIHCLID